MAPCQLLEALRARPALEQQPIGSLPLLTEDSGAFRKGAHREEHIKRGLGLTQDGDVGCVPLGDRRDVLVDAWHRAHVLQAVADARQKGVARDGEGVEPADAAVVGLEVGGFDREVGRVHSVTQLELATREFLCRGARQRTQEL
eukprot:5727968-Prymnesium_polylepis.1